MKVSVVEVKDVDLPEAMKRSMARQAEAEGERRAKVINAEGEFQAADKLRQAAQIMTPYPMAMQMRYLQALADVASDQNSTIIFPLPLELLGPFLKHHRDGRMPRLTGDRRRRAREWRTRRIREDGGSRSNSSNGERERPVACSCRRPRGCQPSPLFRSISGRPCNRRSERWPRCSRAGTGSRRPARRSEWLSTGPRRPGWRPEPKGNRCNPRWPGCNRAVTVAVARLVGLSRQVRGREAWLTTGAEL